MPDYLRQKRLRLLVHKINQERKRQAKKVDILCGDLIGAHREIIRKTAVLVFTAEFYRSIITIRNLDELFDITRTFIENEIHDTKTVFFIRKSDSFDMFTQNSEYNKPHKRSLEGFFTDEIVSSILKASHLCSLEEMMNMGLQIVPTMLKGLSAYAIPLSSCGNVIGFILIYRVSDNKIESEDVETISAVSNGLADAIMSCQPAFSKSQ